MKGLYISFILLTIFQAQRTEAQELSRSVVCTAGETLTTDQLNITYVIGEVVADYLIANGEVRHLTTGFAQPDVELKEKVDKNISHAFALFPNPARGSTVKLAISKVPEGTYSIEIIDALGRILKTQTIVYNQEILLYADIDISSLSKGMYFVRVRNSTDFKGQLKLIKI